MVTWRAPSKGGYSAAPEYARKPGEFPTPPTRPASATPAVVKREYREDIGLLLITWPAREAENG